MAIGTTAAILGGAAIGAIGSGVAASKSSKASRKAADTAAGAQLQAQREQLDYLRDIDRLPRAYREEALGRLGSLFGMPEVDEEGNIIEGTEGPIAREQLLSGITEAPLYQQLLESGRAGQERGEEAIMRHAGVTGGLRSGNVNRALYEYNRDFETDLRNQALLTTYQDRVNQYQNQLQGLQGLAGLPGQTQNITNALGQTANIGATRAQGMIAAGQAQQQGWQGASNAIGSGIGQYLWARGKGII